MNYARNLPLDKSNIPYQAPPAFPTNQSQSGTPVTSSVVTLSDRTTVVDVTVTGANAGNAAIIGKWGSASVTSSNFDWIVNAGQYRTFVVPVSVMGASSVAGANVVNGLYPTLAVKAIGTASVFTAEY